MTTRDRVNELRRQPCADCGGRFHPVCMDFDHRPGTVKVYSVSAMVVAGYRWELVEAEIAKCDVVCANCHRIRTWIARRGRHKKSSGRPPGPRVPRDGRVTVLMLAAELDWRPSRLRRWLKRLRVSRPLGGHLLWTREEADALKRLLLD